MNKKYYGNYCLTFFSMNNEVLQELFPFFKFFIRITYEMLNLYNSVLICSGRVTLLLNKKLYLLIINKSLRSPVF